MENDPDNKWEWKCRFLEKDLAVTRTERDTYKQWYLEDKAENIRLLRLLMVTRLVVVCLSVAALAMGAIACIPRS